MMACFRAHSKLSKVRGGMTRITIEASSKSALAAKATKATTKHHDGVRETLKAKIEELKAVVYRLQNKSNLASVNSQRILNSMASVSFPLSVLSWFIH